MNGRLNAEAHNTLQSLMNLTFNHVESIPKAQIVPLTNQNPRPPTSLLSKAKQNKLNQQEENNMNEIE